MKHIDIAKLASARLRTDPFEYTIVPGFLKPASLQAVIESYPHLRGGSYPLDTLEVPPVLQEVIDELDGPAFERAVAEKFNVDIAGRPKMYTLRGYCRLKDGKIHTDSEDKIITVLLYMNESWPHENGRLRMLRSGDDLDDFAEEVPPEGGTLLIFKRSDRSWHGHTKFEGVRRSIQMNWMVSDSKKNFHKLRHNLSAKVKRLVAGG